MNKRAFLLSFAALATRPAFALYDPTPNVLLARMPGTWTGTLTYRDYQQPDRMVALPTHMTVSMTTPDELALYYVFDDGPGKTVYSYERMAFDFAKAELVWNSGTSKPSRDVYKITSAATKDGNSRIEFEMPTESGLDRYRFEVTPSSWLLSKVESSASGVELLRSKYEFTRSEA